MRPASNDYFFFFFPVFLAFFAFFAFFAMLPSVIPKVGSMQVNIDMHRCRVHHICKIYSSSFEEGKRRSGHRDEGGVNPHSSPRACSVPCLRSPAPCAPA